MQNSRRSTTMLAFLAFLASLAAPLQAGGPLPTTGSPPPGSPGQRNPPPCGQNTCCPQGKSNKPVDFWSGREFLTHTDLALPGPMGITIRRSYDSQTRYDSALGYGWALSYFMRVYEFADGSVILRRDCGVRRSFFFTGGAYQTPVGESGELVKNADGSWTYTERSGERKEFDSQGRLAALVSRAGPRLVFSYDVRGRLPLIGLSPYAMTPTPKEVAREDRLIRIEEQDAAGSATGHSVTLTYDEATGRLIGLSDSAGRSVGYQHDGDGNLTQVDLPEGGVLHYAYEDPKDPHNATSLTDSPCPACAAGAVYVNTYDDQDRVVRQEHGTSVLTIGYDIPFAKTTVTEEVRDDQSNLLRTLTTVWEFNATGNPVKVTDSLGNQRRYTLDPQMNVTQEEVWDNSTGTLVQQEVTTRTYSARGNLLTLTEAVGTPQARTTSYTYHSANRLATVTVKSVVSPAQNKVTRFDYTATTETVTETGLLGDGTPYSHVTTTTLDGNGQRISVDGPRTDVSDVTSFTYDGQGNLQTVTQPLVGKTTYSDFAASGRPRTVTDPNGQAMSYTYDALGRVKTVTVAGHTTSYGYTTTGKIGTITLPRLNTITYDYDTLDRLGSIRDALGNTVNYTYDSAGQRTKREIKDAGGVLQKTVSFQYDVLNRLAQVVNPDSTFTAYGYDAAGNQTSVKNPRNYTTSSVYDALNRLLQTIQPGSIRTAYGYDSQDHLTSVTDANSHTTSYTYDDMGRVAKEVSPDTGTTTYTYDPAGNRTSKTDARNITVSYSYDALNRLTKVDFPTDTDITYSYDTCTNGKGRLCQVVDQAGTTSYAYDAQGRLTQETKGIQGVTYLTGYGYDENANLSSITYPSGRLVNYSYDLADRVSSVTTTPPGGAAQTVATSIAYKPSGGISSLTYGNGLSRTVSYDQQYRITAIKTAGIQDLGYTLDANGNITSVTNNLDATKNKTFGYDTLDRLNSATGPWGSLGYGYDGGGNRLTQTAPEGTSTYTYQSGNNRLASVSGPQPKTFEYDNNGNTTLENSRTYSYSQNNRLIQAAEGSILGEYGYNASEQRVTKTLGGQTTVFHHDQAGHIIEETLANGAVILDYLYLHGQPLAKAEGAALSFIHTDHLATARAMTDANGGKVWETETRPFGDGTTITGSGALNLRFPGQYADQETGLHENWHRWYQPTIGRYMSPDPGWSGRRIEEIQPYLYVSANPLAFVDPLGLEKLEVCCNDWDKEHLEQLLDEAADVQRAYINQQPIPPLSGLGPNGVTTCTVFQSGRPGRPETEYRNFGNGVCADACTRVHEQSHRGECRQIDYLELEQGRSAWVGEALAYAREAWCLRTALLEGLVEVDVDPFGPDNYIKQ